jgi:hypothetical protein
VGDFPDLKTHPLDPNIPPGAEVVEAWVVPLDGVNDHKILPLLRRKGQKQSIVDGHWRSQRALSRRG